MISEVSFKSRNENLASLNDPFASQKKPAFIFSYKKPAI